MWREASSGTSEGSGAVDDNGTSGIITDTSYTLKVNATGNYSIKVTLFNAAGSSIASKPITFTANNDLCKEYSCVV